MSRPIDVATTYYAAFVGETDFASVPMAEGLHFVSPRFELESAKAFREALAQLVPRVQGLEIRHQLHDETSVLTFYELALGAPGGPVPMAERLVFDDGELVDVQLIFDSARLEPAPDSSR